MINLPPIILSILITAEFFLGNFANIFIALVTFIDWVKRQKITTAHRILTALAVSRIGLLWALVIHWYDIAFNLVSYTVVIRIIVYVTWTISNHFSVWLAASLSILYFFKIANFSSLPFLHLKRKVERIILMTLLGSLVCLVFQLAGVRIDRNTWTDEYEGNITWKMKTKFIIHLTDMTIFTVGNFIPFIVSLTCFVLLIFSLWKHLKRMQLSGKGSQDPSTKVHIRAMQTVISFLVCFATYFVTLNIIVWHFNNLKNDLLTLYGQVLVALYPSGHSFILIWGNKKLKQDFLSLLGQVRC